MNHNPVESQRVNLLVQFRTAQGIWRQCIQQLSLLCSRKEQCAFSQACLLPIAWVGWGHLALRQSPGWGEKIFSNTITGPLHTIDHAALLLGGCSVHGKGSLQCSCPSHKTGRLLPQIYFLGFFLNDKNSHTHLRIPVSPCCIPLAVPLQPVIIISDLMLLISLGLILHRFMPILDFTHVSDPVAST